MVTHHHHNSLAQHPTHPTSVRTKKGLRHTPPATHSPQSNCRRFESHRVEAAHTHISLSCSTFTVVCRLSSRFESNTPLPPPYPSCVLCTPFARHVSRFFVFPCIHPATPHQHVCSVITFHRATNTTYRSAQRAREGESVSECVRESGQGALSTTLHNTPHHPPRHKKRHMHAHKKVPSYVVVLFCFGLPSRFWSFGRFGRRRRFQSSFSLCRRVSFFGGPFDGCHMCRPNVRARVF